MSWKDFFRKGPEDVEVVFSGDRLKAGMVCRLLEEEGFHPREWDDMAGPSLGLMGTARVVVPREEVEDARQMLERVREEAAESWEDDFPLGLENGEDPLELEG